MNTEESEQKLEVSSTNAYPVTNQPVPSKDSGTGLGKFISLFKSLPNVGKLVVVGVGILVGFAVLKSLLNLVATLFSLAFLGLLVYFVYQFLVARSSQKIEK